MSTMALAVAALAAAPATATAAAAPSPSPSICTSTAIIQITHFAFFPSSVVPGQISTATVTARNCTNVPQQTTAIWTGRFTNASGGLPPGCPVIDPLAMSVDFAPNGTVQSQVGYLVPGCCTATELIVTVRFEKGGAVVAQATATLIIIQPTTGG
jgi:hypothetical protein